MSIFKPCITAALLSVAYVLPAIGQPKDNAPIRLVVPFAPAGSTDLIARLLAEKAGTILGVTIVIDNKPGAGGDIGSANVAKSPADGRTILLNGTAPLAIGMASGRRMNFDPIKDLTPIGIVAQLPNVVAVPVALPVQSIEQLVAYAKANPGKLSYGMSAVGNLSHLNAEMFAAASGVKLVGIPYKGSAPLITDLIGGTIQLSFDNLPPFLPHFESGKLRALAVTSANRSPLLPNVPALAEVGYAGFDHPARFAFFGPAGLSSAIVQRYNDAFQQALQDPEVLRQLKASAIEPVAGTPDGLARQLKGDREAFAKIIASAGIKFE